MPIKRASGVLAKWLGLSGTAEGRCEALERRALMDAPTAAIVASSIDASGWDISVRYAATSGIDVSTIDGRDMGATSTNGYARLGQLQSTQVQGDGSVIARYRLEAPSANWSWDFSGQYLVGLAPNQVRSMTGEWNVDTGLGSYYHIFWNPVYRLVSPGPYSGNEQFQYRMPVVVEVTNPPWVAAGSPSADVVVSGPGGFESTITAGSVQGSAAVATPWGATRRYTLMGVGLPPGGVMTAAENGRYDYRVRVMDRGVERTRFLGASFYFWWGNPEGFNGGSGTPGPTVPGVSVLSTHLLSDSYTIAVRYSAAGGAAFSSIDATDLSVSITKPDSFYRQTDRFYASVTRPVTLVSAQTLSSGDVVAVYRATPSAAGGWTRYEAGDMTLMLAEGAVRSNTGATFAGGVLETRSNSFLAPATTNLAVYGSGATNLDLSYRLLDIDDEMWQYDLSSARPGETTTQTWLRSLGEHAEVVGPDGTIYTPTYTYFGLVGANSNAGWRGWNVRMSIALPSGWGHGSWSVYLKDDALHVAGGQASARTLIGTIVA